VCVCVCVCVFNPPVDTLMYWIVEHQWHFPSVSVALETIVPYLASPLGRDGNRRLVVLKDKHWHVLLSDVVVDDVVVVKVRGTCACVCVCVCVCV
jgi:hypothetical protein